VVTRYDELRTDRLLLRRWRDEDREPFAAMNADPDVMRYFPALLDRAASDAFVDRIEGLFETEGYGLWALESLSEHEFLGFTGLLPMPPGVPGEGGLEVGWRLRASAWGQGYATEAARAAVGLAFDEIRLDGAPLAEIWSMTAVVNTPSRRVMERLGMTPYTEFEHPKVPEGHPVRPHVLYRLLRSERSAAWP
jgi:RimJ/RimL family protein N-acetyltransferase